MSEEDWKRRAESAEQALREIMNASWYNGKDTVTWIRSRARAALSSEDATRPTGDKE